MRSFSPVTKVQFPWGRPAPEVAMGALGGSGWTCGCTQRDYNYILESSFLENPSAFKIMRIVNDNLFGGNCNFSGNYSQFWLLSTLWKDCDQVPKNIVMIPICPECLNMSIGWACMHAITTIYSCQPFPPHCNLNALSAEALKNWRIFTSKVESSLSLSCHDFSKDVLLTSAPTCKLSVQEHAHILIAKYLISNIISFTHALPFWEGFHK